MSPEEGTVYPGTGVIVSHHVGLGKLNSVLWKQQSVLLITESFLAPAFANLISKYHWVK